MCLHKYIKMTEFSLCNCNPKALVSFSDHLNPTSLLFLEESRHQLMKEMQISWPLTIRLSLAGCALIFSCSGGCERFKNCPGQDIWPSFVKPETKNDFFFFLISLLTCILDSVVWSR